MAENKEPAGKEQGASRQGARSKEPAGKGAAATEQLSNWQLATEQRQLSS